MEGDLCAARKCDRVFFNRRVVIVVQLKVRVERNPSVCVVIRKIVFIQRDNDFCSLDGVRSDLIGRVVFIDSSSRTFQGFKNPVVTDEIRQIIMEGRIKCFTRHVVAYRACDIQFKNIVPVQREFQRVIGYIRQ